MIRFLPWLHWGIYASGVLLLLDGLALVYYWGRLNYDLTGLVIFYGCPVLLSALIAFIVTYLLLRNA